MRRGRDPSGVALAEFLSQTDRGVLVVVLVDRPRYGEGQYEVVWVGCVPALSSVAQKVIVVAALVVVLFAQ